MAGEGRRLQGAQVGGREVAEGWELEVWAAEGREGGVTPSLNSLWGVVPCSGGGVRRGGG